MPKNNKLILLSATINAKQDYQKKLFNMRLSDGQMELCSNHMSIDMEMN